jgi:predicted nucleotidyltransferase
MTITPASITDLPDTIRRNLEIFAASALEACGPDLVSLVLFGSAAEGRLRASSDVNLILVLKQFVPDRINGLRESLRVAHAAVQLETMFLLESEIPAAAEAFAVKFADIQDRHRILFGTDPFASLEVSRDATLRRLRQVLVNLTLRLRERYALVSLREERLVPVIADCAGPIRAAAATILRLEGKANMPPKEALLDLTGRLRTGVWDKVLKNMSAAREELELPPDEPGAAVLGLLELLQAIQTHVNGMTIDGKKA